MSRISRTLAKDFKCNDIRRATRNILGLFKELEVEYQYAEHEVEWFYSLYKTYKRELGLNTLKTIAIAPNDDSLDDDPIMISIIVRGDVGQVKEFIERFPHDP